MTQQSKMKENYPLITIVVETLNAKETLDRCKIINTGQNYFFQKNVRMSLPHNGPIQDCSPLNRYDIFDGTFSTL